MNRLREVLLTTSRNPTPRMRTFCSDLARVIPSTVHVNRGKMSTDEVAEKALEQDADRVVIIDRWHGGPGKINFFRVGESGLVSIPPVIHIAGIRLHREFGVSKVKPALSLVLSEPNASEAVLRVADALSRFFGIPLRSVREAVRASPTLMCVSRDKFHRIAITFMVEPEHVEIGPRVSVSSVEW